MAVAMLPGAPPRIWSLRSKTAADDERLAWPAIVFST
jgi:hypothetical protein